MDIWEQAIHSIYPPSPEQIVWKVPTIEDKLGLVLIEGRDHSWLQGILYNVAHIYGGKNIPLYIIHTHQNKGTIHKITYDWKGVQYRNLEKDNITLDDYNTMLCSSIFYSQFITQFILIFQTDTLIRKVIPEQYFQYDYVGAVWPESFIPIWKHRYPSFDWSNPSRVGNGGLSLRNVERMKELCDKNENNYNMPEDMFLSQTLSTNRCPPEIASKFCVEHIYYPDPIAIHQGYNFHPVNKVKLWLNNVPGISVMSKYRICIVGACQNVETFLPQVLENFDTIASWFKECKVVIFENDSTDNTPKILDEWSKKGGHKTILTETNVSMRIPHRIERLAYIRNRLLYHVPPFFDYMFMVDMDDVFANPIQKKSFESCFEIEDQWDIVAANTDNYYDIYALRVPGLIEFDCWDRYYELQRRYGMSEPHAKVEAIEKYKKIMTDIKECLPVYSAFNAGILCHISSIRICCRFSPINEKKQIVCEHVPFQNCIRSHGGRILFNPNFKL